MQSADKHVRMMHLLTITWDFDPVFLRIFGLDIRYYGLMWMLAILIGAIFFDRFCKREGLPPKVADSIFWYGTVATIVGARLGHCLFYDTMDYLREPWTIITGFRDGGLASHGAAIGLLIGLWLFSRKNKLPYIWSLDRIMIPVGIGDRSAMGVRVRPFEQMALRIRSRRRASDADLRSAVLSGDLRPALLALL